MGTTILLRGECTIWKNNVYSTKMDSDFSYDYDLQIFKLINRGNAWSAREQGNIWTSFKPPSVQQVTTNKVGTLLKKWQISISAKWPNGDEFTFVFGPGDEKQVRDVKAEIERIVAGNKGLDEVIRLLKTRERVPTSDVAKLLSKFNLDATDKGVQRVVESAITSGQVEGVFDGKEFVSKYGLQRETVRYDIVTKFEMSSSGAIVINCPKCGAAIPLQGKESNGNCKFCGTPYTIPRKILDLV